MTKFEQDLKDCIGILDTLTRASSHLADNLPVINSNSRENIIDAHPKGYFSISIVEDVFCSCLFIMRTLSILSTYVNEGRNYLTLKELSSEKSFWLRKLLEHLLRSILLSESTDTEFRLYLRYDILEYCVRNSEEQKRIFGENSEHLSGIHIQIEKIIEHKEKNGCNLDFMIRDKLGPKIRPFKTFDDLYEKAIDVGNWHEKMILGGGISSIFYGQFSLQIHSNLEYHNEDFSPDILLETIFGYMTNVIELLLIHLYKINNIELPDALKEMQKKDYEKEYKTIFMKELKPGDTVIHQGRNRKGLVIDRDLGSKNFHYLYRIQYFDTKEDEIVSSIYLTQVLS